MADMEMESGPRKHGNVVSQSVLLDLCEALGLNPGHVHSIEITRDEVRVSRRFSVEALSVG